MKPFDQFAEYAEEHVVEIVQDIVSDFIDNIQKSTFTKEDIVLMNKMCQSTCMSLLHAYHDWLSE